MALVTAKHNDCLHYDIAIVGAGIAGSALACALSTDDALAEHVGRASKRITAPRIALIEAQPLRSGWPPIATEPDSFPEFDPRVSALTAGSQRFLTRIGIWPAIARQRVSPFGKMHVWDAEGTGVIDFDAAEVRAPVLGHIVENRVTVAALINQLRDCSNVDILDGVPVDTLHLSNEAEPKKENSVADESSESHIVLADGRVIASPLIVAADGANSPLRAMAHMATREWDYDHSAVVCTVRTSSTHDKTAWQRFTAHGPLAFLPLALADNSEQGEHYCSVVWSQQCEQTDSVMALDDNDFCRALGAAFEHRLGEVTACSRRFSFPLRQRHAVDYVKPGFALLADAAHAIHPLAGQGINLGLADVDVLAQCLLSARARGQGVGDNEVLQKYQRARKGDNLAMMAAVEGFKRAFEPLPLPLRWFRNAGMNAIDQRGAIKNRIIKHAMGIA